MTPSTPRRPLLSRTARPTSIALERNLTQGRAAIELVATGVATRVGLHGLRHASRLALELALEAERAGVQVRIEDNPTGTPSLVVGPRAAEGQPR